MKPALAVTFTIVSLLCARAVAAQQPAPRTIVVNGSAEIRVPPNQVVLTVGVETHSTDVAAARSESDRRIKAIAEAARGLGIAPEHVKTDFLEIQPRYRDESMRQEFLGYFVRRTLSITLDDVTKFESLLTASLAAGANYVHGVDFRTTELRKHRDAVRALALVAAREKAADMAASLNGAIGSPISIQEGYAGWSSPYGSWWGYRGGGSMTQNVVQESGGRSGPADDALVPGQIGVTANVSVTFELAPRR